MTTTTTTQLQHRSPSRVRRILPAVLVGAALFASAAVAANRLIDDDPPRAAARITNSSTADLTMMNNAIHVFTPPESTADLTMMNNAIHVFTPPESTADVASPQARLVIDEESWNACALGVTDLCGFTHTWVTDGVDTSHALFAVCGSGLAWACSFTPVLGG